MPSSSYVDYAVELLAGLGPVRPRAMMGGHIVHCGGVAIALVYDDRLYLKTDEETRETFLAAGGEPFTYELRGRVVEMSYCTPPDAALDSAEAMQPWAELALAAALRKHRKAKTTTRAGPGSPRGASSHRGVALRAGPGAERADPPPDESPTPRGFRAGRPRE